MSLSKEEFCKQQFPSEEPLLMAKTLCSDMLGNLFLISRGSGENLRMGTSAIANFEVTNDLTALKALYKVRSEQLKEDPADSRMK